MNGQLPEVREESQRESAFFGLMSASGDDAFGKASMQRINVLSIQRISAAERVADSTLVRQAHAKLT